MTQRQGFHKVSMTYTMLDAGEHSMLQVISERAGDYIPEGYAGADARSPEVRRLQSYGMVVDRGETSPSIVITDHGRRSLAKSMREYEVMRHAAARQRAHDDWIDDVPEVRPGIHESSDWREDVAEIDRRNAALAAALARVDADAAARRAEIDRLYPIPAA